MKTINTRFKIHRSIIAALNLFQSQDGSRYSITGTHFECRKDGVLLVATDGRRLATYHLERSVLMPADTELVKFTADTTGALRLLRDAKLEWTVDLTDDGKEVRFSITPDAAYVTKNIEADKAGSEYNAKDSTFPSWRRVVPTTPPQAINEYAFDPELMNEFTKASKLLANGRGIRMVSHAETGVDSAPFSVWLSDPQFYGLLMPLRWSNPTQGPPDWCRLPVAPPAPEKAPDATTTPPAPATA